MVNEQLRKAIPVVGAVMVLAVVGIYIYRDVRIPVNTSSSDRSDSTATSTIENPTEGKDYTITPLPPVALISTPDLGRTIVFGSSVNAEVKTIITNNVAQITSDLKTNSERVDRWMDLGMQYKLAGDYEGARAVWEYVAARAPSDPISFYNLGDLYGNYLNKPDLAEKNFKIAIKNNPKSIATYRALHELYRYHYPAKQNLADDILTEGIKANPTAVDLMAVLAAYYRDSGDLVQARTSYDQAIAEATKQGNTALVAALKEDRAALGQ